MNKFLKYLYRTFIRDKVQELYLSEGKIYKVLGENFLNGYYFLVLEAKEYSFSSPEYYLIVENCKKPLVVELKLADKNSEYVKFDKVAFRKMLPKNIFNILANNGLCTTVKNTLKNESNLLTVHRLTMCLYKNILGLTVHHNDKDKRNNVITNLTPLDNFTHQRLDVKPEPTFTQLTQKYNKEFEIEYFKSRRNTLASRVQNIITILYKLYEGHQTKKIVSKKYKKSRIYEIKNHFYYLNEFIEFLETFTNPVRNGFNGKTNSTWEDIYFFEFCYRPQIYDLERFAENLYKYFPKPRYPT